MTKCDDITTQNTDITWTFSFPDDSTLPRNKQTCSGHRIVFEQITKGLRKRDCRISLADCDSEFNRSSKTANDLLLLK